MEFSKVLREDFQINSLPTRFKQLEEFRTRLNFDLKNDNILYLDATKFLIDSNQLTFYLYDNHLNKNGHEIVGKALASQVSQMIIARNRN